MHPDQISCIRKMFYFVFFKPFLSHLICPSLTEFEWYFWACWFPALRGVHRIYWIGLDTYLDLDLVWWIQLILTYRKFVLLVGGIFWIKWVLFEFAIINLGLIYFCISEIFKNSVSNQLFDCKITYGICVVFCELEVIL